MKPIQVLDFGVLTKNYAQHCTCWTTLRHKGIKNIASIRCCIINLIRVLITIVSLITMPLHMFRKLVNSRFQKTIVKSWMEASEKAFSPLSQLRLEYLTDYGHMKAKSLILYGLNSNPIPNKYLGCGYKGLVFCRNNGWLMENMV